MEKRRNNFIQKIINEIKNKPKRYLVIFWALVFLVFLSYNIMFREFEISFLSEKGRGCSSRFGFYCPACGGTRMTHNFLLFNFGQSFVFNPVIFLLYCFILIYIVIITFQIFFKKKLFVPNFTVLSLVFVFSLVAFTVVRNFVPFLQT